MSGGLLVTVANQSICNQGKIILFKTGLGRERIRSEQLLYIVLNGLLHLLMLHLCGGGGLIEVFNHSHRTFFFCN